MTERWRPNFKAKWKKEIEKFLEENPDIPFTDPREFVKFCVDKEIMKFAEIDQTVEQAAINKIKKDLDLG